MSVSKICEPCCQCIGDHCRVSKTVLHVTAAIIWIGGIVAVNAKLIIYMLTVSQGETSEYDITCLPDSDGDNRTYIPFALGATFGLLQVPWIFKFVRKNHTRIEQLPLNDSFLVSQHKSCYECYFLSFLCTIIMSFVILDEILCGKDDHSENVEGSKCVFIGLDACVGLFLFFGFSGFIVSWVKGPLEGAEYGQLDDDALLMDRDDHAPDTVI